MTTRELTVSGGSFELKERVKQAVDIVDLVGSYVSLRRQGRIFVGLCPWHDDTHPSLQVNPERQTFRCWVCNIGGDVFSFAMKMEGVEFPEALRLLADRAGIRIERPRRRADQAATPPAGKWEKRTLYQAMGWAEKEYHHCLLHSPEAEPARRYLHERGISPSSIEQFQLGFSPPQKDWIIRRAEELSGSNDPQRLRRRLKIFEVIGLLSRSAETGMLYDRFKGRLLFSIRDSQGRAVGFGGRVLPEFGPSDAAKYINSPETPLFSKSRLLYGLDAARNAIRKARSVLVMEGYTDVITAHQYGFQNAVAVLGTALGEWHVKMLKAHADRIILVLDGDEAGVRRTSEVLELFVAQQADLQVLILPEGLDPCDFLQKYGPEAFARLLAERAADALEYAFTVKTAGLDLERDIHGASQALEDLLSIIACAPRLRLGAGGESRFREEKILQRLAVRFRVDENELRRRLAALRRSRMRRPAVASPGKEEQKPAVVKEAWERELLELLLAQPNCLPAIREQVRGENFATEECRRIFESCCRLADAGETPSFEQLMLEIEEPRLKSLLVELDEGGRAKEYATVAAEELIDQLIKTMWRKEVERRRAVDIAALREGKLDDREQAAMLEEIIRQKRKLS